MAPLITIVRNWSVLAGAQVVSSLIAMVFLVLVSRTLGEVEFGRLYLALTLTAIVGVVVDFGLSQVVTRSVARDRALARPYFRRAALIVGALGAGLYLLLVGTALALGYTTEVVSLVLILGLLMVVEAFSQLLGALFQAHEQMLVPAIARVGGNVITLALVVPLLFRGHGAATVAAVIVVAAAARVGFQAIAARRLSGFGLPAPAAPSLRSLLRAGIPFLTANGFALFVARVDVLILGQLAGAAAVGWYGAASRLVEAFYFLPVLLTTATFPVLSRLWSEDKNEFHATVRKTLDLLIVLIVPLSVTFFILAESIVGSLFTLESYGPSVPLLRIQAVSLVLIFVDYLLTCILLATGRERTWIAILGVACLVNPALNFVLIPLTSAAYANGAIGAALATLLTEIFILICALRVVAAGTFDAGTVRVAVRAAGLGGALALGLLASRSVGIPWILAAAVGGAGYFAAVLRLGLLPPDIKAWVGSLVRRRRQVALSTVSTELDAA